MLVAQSSIVHKYSLTEHASMAEANVSMLMCGTKVVNRIYIILVRMLALSP